MSSENTTRVLPGRGANEELFDGRYRILSELGHGGMASVYLAEDTHLQRRVALKVLDARLARNATFVARFRHEAKAAARLSHPNVVSVYDRGELDDGTCYIAMAYVPGPTLRELLDRGMTIDEAVDAAQQILAAAGAAHRLGIVHRDLKPQNVLADPSGRLEVTDFGIARSADEALTDTGTVLGSADYLAPEQAMGEPVTPRADLYSVGVILYEALTGRKPFEAESAVAVTMMKLSETPVSPDQLNPAVTPALAAVVMRALAREPEQRFTSAEEFADALDRALAGQAPAAPRAAPPVQPAAPRSKRRWWMWLLAALALAAIGALVAWSTTRAKPQPPSGAIVPSVVGERLGQAKEILAEAGFGVGVTRKADPVPRGQVIGQVPSAGSRLRAGAAVELVVSRGPRRAEVPDVVGLKTQRAQRELERVGLEPVVEHQNSDEYPAGYVLATSPSAGTKLKPGGRVTAVVSDGPAPGLVPAVVGMAQIQAEREISKAGFLSQAKSRHSDDPIGKVIGQSPASGTRLRAGKKIVIFVSAGPKTAAVPSVVGLPLRKAERLLSKRGFDVVVSESESEDPTEAGLVISQNPLAGRQLERGSTVRIVVARGPQASARA